ncbi:hypothetical protein HX037_05230 [Ignatzschineria indica]|nr:hypothetical protein [Ignatzschineria indica]MDM1545285.1 hypothetical protein [Ignatzschineria indica]
MVQKDSMPASIAILTISYTETKRADAVPVLTITFFQKLRAGNGHYLIT